jgi:hypothetical protein
MDTLQLFIIILIILFTILFTIYYGVYITGKRNGINKERRRCERICHQAYVIGCSPSVKEVWRTILNEQSEKEMVEELERIVEQVKRYKNG